MSNIPIPERIRWLGASESAALFDCSPYCTRFELYHIKAGNIPSPFLDDDERVQAGQFLEPAIAAWASEKWEWSLRNVEEYLVNPNVEQMGASLDFETADGEPTEIKNVDSLVFRDGDYEVEGDTLLDAPVHFLIQIQHQLSCRPEAMRGWLVVCVGGNRLYRLEVARHEGLIAKIETEVEAFWQSVHAGIEPKPNFALDAGTISLLYAHQGDETVDMRGNNEFSMLCHEYKDAHGVEKGGKDRKSAALAEIKTMMGDASTAIADDGFKVTSSLVKESTIHRSAHRRFSITRKEKEEKLHGTK